MREHKVVVLGSMGAGKSTLVRAISAGQVVDTDVANCDPDSSKATTTVALDYADIELPDGDRLRLYGAPGQQRFDFVWPTLLQGAAGVIVMVDASLPTVAEDFANYLRVAREAGQMPVVVGISHLDLASDADSTFADVAAIAGHALPVLPVDARDEAQVLMLMDVLVSEIESASLAGCL